MQIHNWTTTLFLINKPELIKTNILTKTYFSKSLPNHFGRPLCSYLKQLIFTPLFLLLQVVKIHLTEISLRATSCTLRPLASPQCACTGKDCCSTYKWHRQDSLGRDRLGGAGAGSNTCPWALCELITTDVTLIKDSLQVRANGGHLNRHLIFVFFCFFRTLIW